LLTGQPPFPQGTAREKLDLHVTDSPLRLRDLRSEVPDAIVSIVAKMMAKLPEDRFQNVAEIVLAFDGWLPRRTRNRRKRTLLAAAAALGLAAAAMAIAYWLSPGRGGDNQPASMAQQIKTKEAPNPKVDLAKAGEVRRWIGHGNAPVRRILIARDGATAWSVADDFRCWDFATGTTRASATPSQITWVYHPQYLLPDVVKKETIIINGPWYAKDHHREKSEMSWTYKLGYFGAATPSVTVANSQWHEELLSLGGQLLTTDGATGYLRFHDPGTLKILRSLGPGPNRYYQASPFPDGRRLLTGSDDGVTRIWDLNTGEIAGHLPQQSGPISCVDVSPDGCYALTASFSDGQLKVWNVKTKSVQWKLEGQVGRTAAACFMHDGRIVLSYGRAGGIRLFDLQSGVETKVLQTPETATTWAWVAPLKDGRHLVTASSDANLRLWDLSTARELYRARVDIAVVSLAVTPDGQQVLLGSDKGEIVQWRLPIPTPNDGAPRE
jgi:hypothetical protein